MDGACEECGEWFPNLWTWTMSGYPRAWELCEGCVENRHVIIDALNMSSVKRSARLDIRKDKDGREYIGE